MTTAKRPNMRPVEWLNFFLADVQTGVGPFLAAYLAASGWNPGRVGYVLTFGGLVTVIVQTPAGAIVDTTHRKRLLLGASLGLLVSGALLLLLPVHAWNVYSAQMLIGGAGPFLGPTLAAITLGMVGAGGFDRQFGRNQAFNSAGNVLTALLVAVLSYTLGYRSIFAAVIVLSIPALLSIVRIDAGAIDYARARGGKEGVRREDGERLSELVQDRVLLLFLVCCFLFHLANAAMLPQLGELLSRHRSREAGPFMAACVIVTQLVIACCAARIGRLAERIGRKPLLLLGFGVLPLRGVLYTLTQTTGLLIAIQILDGIANAIFGVVSVLVIADRTRGTGRFNLASGMLATMVGIGAALSATIGGQLVQHAGYRISFLGLGGVAAVAFLLLLVGLPETGQGGGGELDAAAERDTVRAQAS